MGKIYLAAAFIIVLMLAFTKPPPASRNFSLKQLAPGVWTALQNDKGGHAISNAGIIDLGNKTLVFDAFINPDAAIELKQAAEQLTKHKVAFVVNSHFHDDHIRGTQVFVPGALVISTEWTKNEIQKTEPGEQAWAKKNISTRLDKARQQLQEASTDEKEEAAMWLAYFEAISQSLPKLKTVLPDVTFKDSMWIHGPKRSVLLVECKNGHTGSDVVMILPKEGIAFMGDLLFVQRHPWLSDGDADGWKRHLEHFNADISLKQFVPGHGPVAGKEALQDMIHYIGDLQQMALQAVRSREPDSIFLKRTVPPQYKNWWYARFYPANLDFMYAKARSKNKN
jgi:glyoxylase-like metal-dependent hydrolase (beta-lactamase superfamily II)